MDEVGRERGSPECPRRIKGKYSASRRHLTSVLPGRGISILKGSWSWSRSKRIPRILPSQLRPLPLLLLLLLYFFFLLLLLFSAAFAFSSNSLLLNFLPFLFQRAFWLTLSLKAQYPPLRRYHFPIKVKSYATLKGAKGPTIPQRGDGGSAASHSRIADVTMWVNRYARRSSKLRYLREFYYRLSHQWMAVGLMRRTERFFTTLVCVS